MRSLCSALVLGLLALSATAEERPKVDLAALEDVEESAESLANSLLGLSVATRERDLERCAEFLADAFSAPPFPARPGELRRGGKWIATHGWEPEAGGDPVGKAAWLAGWGRFLDHFGEIEDARFEVTQASFDADGHARTAFYLVGRDTAGHREWARGLAQITARQQNGRWRIASFDLQSLESMTADTDLFSEVAAPAGLALPRTVPSPADRPMLPFAWLSRGAAAGDLNGDGWIDLFVASASGNHLYLNDGHGGFRDVTEAAGVKSAGGPSNWASGPAAPLILDYDNDGDEDVFLSVAGNQVLLENRLVPDGKLVFRDVSKSAGVAVFAYGFSASAGDVNGDGLPDIYVACYDDFLRDHPNSYSASVNATPNLLFVNQGDGTFKEEAERWGVADPRWSLAATFADVDDDGRLDLFVANDYGEKGLFMNKGDHFVDEARERGVLDPGFGMGVSFGDYDNDGILDLHATDMSTTAGNRILSRIYGNPEPTADLLKKLARGNSLFHGLGGGRFQDVTADAGGLAAGWAWGGGFLDVDNDGWEDLYTPNGFVSGASMKDTESHFWRQVVRSTEFLRGSAAVPRRSDPTKLMHQDGYSFAGYQRDVLRLNQGGGRFLDVSGVSGIDSVTDGRGAVYADFDNDGDLDVFLTTQRGPGPLLFRNNVGQSSGFLRVSLEGTRAGRDAFGAVVRVRTSAGTLTKVKSGGGGFISQPDPRLLFGLGGDPRAESVEVAWPNGVKERFSGDFAAGASVLLRQGTGRAQPLAVRPARLPDPLSTAERAARALNVRVGASLPDAPVASATGERAPLRSLLQPGRRTLIYLWATWAGRSGAALAELEQLRQPLAARGIDVLAVDLDTDPGADVAGFATDHGLRPPSWIGGVPAVEALFSTDELALPVSILVDPTGGVVEILAGWSEPTRRRLRLLAGERR